MEPIKNKPNVTDVTETKNNTVIKEASKRKRNEVPRKELKKKIKGEVRETEEEEEKMGYEIEKLLHDRRCKGVWEIEVKWKDHEKTTWEPIKKHQTRSTKDDGTIYE